MATPDPEGFAQMIDYTQNPKCLEWASERIGDTFDPRLTSWIAQVSEAGEVEAVVLFTGWSDANVFMSVAADKPGTRAFVKAVFEYAFNTLGCHRVTMMARTNNTNSSELHKRLGATHEAILKGFYGAEDAACSRILKSECRWIGAFNVEPIQDAQSA